MDEDGRNAFGILETRDGAGVGICDDGPLTCSSFSLKKKKKEIECHLLQYWIPL